MVFLKSKMFLFFLVKSKLKQKFAESKERLKKSIPERFGSADGGAKYLAAALIAQFTFMHPTEIAIGEYVGVAADVFQYNWNYLNSVGVPLSIGYFFVRDSAVSFFNMGKKMHPALRSAVSALPFAIVNGLESGARYNLMGEDDPVVIGGLSVVSALTGFFRGYLYAELFDITKNALGIESFDKTKMSKGFNLVNYLPKKTQTAAILTLFAASTYLSDNFYNHKNFELAKPEVSLYKKHLSALGLYSLPDQKADSTYQVKPSDYSNSSIDQLVE